MQCLEIITPVKVTVKKSHKPLDLAGYLFCISGLGPNPGLSFLANQRLGKEFHELVCHNTKDNSTVSADFFIIISYLHNTPKIEIQQAKAWARNIEQKVGLTVDKPKVWAVQALPVPK